MIKNYYLKIKKLFFSKTARYSGIVFVGNIVAAGLGFLSMVIVSRVLGPYNFGILSIVMAVIAVINGLTDFGIGTGVVRFSSLYLENNQDRADALMKLAFNLEIIIGVLIVIFGLIFVHPLANLLGGEYLVFPLKLALLGGLGLSMSAYVNMIMQAYQKFLKFSLLAIGVAFLKLAGIGILFVLSILSLNNAVILYAVIPVIGFIIGFFLIPKKFLWQKPQTSQKEVFIELFHFSKWLMVSFLATTIIGRLDIFLLSHFRGSEQVGIYAAAFQLSLFLPLLLGAIITVLIPRVSKFTKKEEFISFIKKSLLGSTLIVLIMLPILIFAKQFILLIFGSKYENSILPFQILFVNFLIAIMANPICTIIYALNKTKITAFINIIQLLLGIVLFYFLIQNFGTVGAALGQLSIGTIGPLAVVGYVFWAVNNLDNKYSN